MATAEDTATPTKTIDQDIDQHPRPRRVGRDAGVSPNVAAADTVAASTGSDFSAHHLAVATAAFNRPGAMGNNGDERDFPTRIGNFHKGLKHDKFGEVKPVAYDALVAALANRLKGQAFEDAINLERNQPPFGRKLINPQAGFSGDTEGPAPDSLQMAAPPKVDSA